MSQRTCTRIEQRVVGLRFAVAAPKRPVWFAGSDGSGVRSSRRGGRCAPFLFAPGGDGEAGADQEGDDAADPAPGSGVVGEDEKGDEAEVVPYRAAQTGEDAPAGSAAGGEY